MDWIGPQQLGLYCHPENLDPLAIQGDLVNLALAAIIGYDPALTGAGLKEFSGLLSGFLSEKQAIDSVRRGDYVRTILGIAGIFPRVGSLAAAGSLVVDVGSTCEVVSGR
jgi:hypothetical protein